MSHREHNVQSPIEHLKEITGWNQVQLGRFIGVSSVSVNHWLRGRRKPEGINTMVITLALVIAQDSPDLLRATLESEYPRDPVAVIARFLGNDAGLHYWLGLASPYSVTDLANTPAMGRIALLLELVSVFLPNRAERIRRGYGEGVARVRAMRAEAVKASDARSKARRDDWRKNRQRLREE